jgi:glutathione S-transferase
MQLYTFHRSPNCRKVLLLLRHLDVEVDFVEVNLDSGAQFAPEYLALNPNGRVPTLVDGDFVLWESGAILTHLAERHWPEGLGRPGRGRSEVARWMFFEASGIAPYAKLVALHTVLLPEPLRRPDAAEAARWELDRRLVVLDRQLSDREFVAGELSVADFALGAMAGAIADGGAMPEEQHGIRSWLERLAALPAWRYTVHI